MSFASDISRLPRVASLQERYKTFCSSASQSVSSRDRPLHLITVRGKGSLLFLFDRSECCRATFEPTVSLHSWDPT